MALGDQTYGKCTKKGTFSFVEKNSLRGFVVILFEKFNSLLIWFVVMQDGVFSDVLG